MRAFIYENKTEEFYPENKFLKIKLKGRDKNLDAIGSKVFIYSGDKAFNIEQMPIRGFQSTVDNNLIFGVGDIDVVDSIIVNWYDGSMSKVQNISTNQSLIFDIKDSEVSDNTSRKKENIYLNFTYFINNI